ncbi:unnamed protein product, partial [Meganyctiphanes norvegica]
SNLIPISVLGDRMFSSKFIKVMNTRHPLQRLVSAYRDKFRDGRKGWEEREFTELIDKYLPERRGSTDITFPEFLRIIVGEQKMGVDANGHWRSYYKNCSPCTLPYDYIMQLETHDEDLEYIFNMTGINDRNVELRRHATSREDSESNYWLYYDVVDDDLLRETYHIYKEDFQMFGYEIPKFLQRVIQN